MRFDQVQLQRLSCYRQICQADRMHPTGCLHYTEFALRYGIQHFVREYDFYKVNLEFEVNATSCTEPHTLNVMHKVSACE